MSGRSKNFECDISNETNPYIKEKIKCSCEHSESEITGLHRIPVNRNCKKSPHSVCLLMLMNSSLEVHKFFAFPLDSHCFEASPHYYLSTFLHPFMQFLLHAFSALFDVGSFTTYQTAHVLVQSHSPDHISTGKSWKKPLISILLSISSPPSLHSLKMLCSQFTPLVLTCVNFLEGNVFFQLTP